MLQFTVADYLALAWFLLSWVGYTVAADHTRLRHRSITVIMDRHRERWMQTMLCRDDPRVVDTIIQGSLLSGIAFFASTSIIVVGGLVAMLGATDRAMDVLSELPFAVTPNAAEWELKLLLLTTIFVYAFFKFAWSFRLLKYCSILIGAAPLSRESTPNNKRYAQRIAKLISLEAKHFNQGLRAFFFALGALGWFVHPYVFIAATAWVTMVLYRREFRSRSLALLKEL